jgi:ADP-ribose pyrophosphatase YjhB (NUDIX family)
MWHLPGVTLHYQESVADAVQRITQDELGIQVEIDSFLDFIEYRHEEEKRGYGHAVSLVFLCHPSDPKAPIVLNEEASEYKYFTEIPENTISQHAEFLTKKGFIK